MAEYSTNLFNIPVGRATSLSIFPVPFATGSGGVCCAAGFAHSEIPESN